MNYLKFLVNDKLVDAEGNLVGEEADLKNMTNIYGITNLTDEEKNIVFGSEINDIKNYNVKVIVIKILESLPNEFWFRPNKSEYGKTPEDEKGVGGVVLHSKKAFKIAKKLIKAWDISDYKRDIVLAATLLHDCFLDSFSTADKDEIFHLHLIQPRIKFLDYEYLIANEEDKDAFDLIMKGIEGHTGGKCLIQSLRYRKENDFLKIVHIADFLANDQEVVK